jgi:ABC-type polysaccharide/polyol phosphate export permease
MKLSPPKKNTFWAAVIVAAVGVVVYAVHVFAQSIPHLQLIAFLLVLVAFVLLCLGLTQKEL